jgi:hypothetical protein
MLQWSKLQSQKVEPEGSIWEDGNLARHYRTIYVKMSPTPYGDLKTTTATASSTQNNTIRDETNFVQKMYEGITVGTVSGLKESEYRRKRMLVKS